MPKLQTVLLTCFVMTLGRGRPAAAEEIRWDFNADREVTETANIEPGLVTEGHLSGRTTWDPHFSLRLPTQEIDARRFTWLTVRLYSSAPADLLDVYYHSPDGRWCLGGKFPIRKGWATYCMDLTQNHWRETTSGDASKQWGGPSKRVNSLRIDPGNQADRWVAVDYVRLQTAEPGFREGVVAEPRGTARLVKLTAPDKIAAGKPLVVSAQLEIEPPTELASPFAKGAGSDGRGTVVVCLRRGDTVLRFVERAVRLTEKTLAVQAALPISPYWYPGPAMVEVGCYELDPAEVATTSRPLEITSDRVGTVRPPVAELRRLGGDAAIHLNGRPLPGFLYVSAGALRLDCHREMAQAGVHLYADWFGGSMASDMGHVAPDRYDYAEFDRYFAAVLDADPQAYFMPHIGVTGPQWWQKAHPEELCQFENGTKGPTSFASERWRRDMGDDLRRLIAYLRKAPYADRILGYMFFNGYTAEWQMWGTWEASRDDYSQPALRAFRAFLAKRYGTDARLRAAWNDPQVTLPTATLPNWSARRPGGPQVLRDPQSERRAVDFYEFISNMDADALLYVARIVREATAGKALVGTYYAYLTAHGINQQDSGHLAARRVFDSPDIDFLMSPPNYYYRCPGEAGTFMSATDSLRLRGKLWLDESDHRTFLTDPSAGYGRADTLEETRGVFWREFVEVLTKRAAVSWFDMSGGWFSHPRLLADVGRAGRIMAESLPRRKAFQPEICVLVDPQSFYWMRSTTANAALDVYQVAIMPQAGAAWDFCLLDDLCAGRLPDYKLYVFLNAFYVDPARREAIHAKLKRNGATALFAYAPGYLGPHGASLPAMAALSGIRIAKDDAEGRPQLLLEPNDPLARGLAPQTPVGAKDLTVAPRFYAEDPAAHIAGRLVGSRQAGLVVKPMDGWTSIYSAAMQLPAGLMRNIARSAGVHVWLETDDALYLDDQFAGIHAATAGVKRLHLPDDRRVFDAISGEPLVVEGRVVRLSMQRAETRLLRFEKR